MATMPGAAAVSQDLRQRVLGRIDEDEVLRLAQDLIRIPSFTTEETPCAEWLANYLGDQGLEVELQEIEPGRKQAIARLRPRQAYLTHMGHEMEYEALASRLTPGVAPAYDGLRFDF